MNKNLICKVMVLCVFPLILVLFLLLFTGAGDKNAQQSNAADHVVSYESVLICKGDTLWTIAASYLKGSSNAEIQQYVEEIASLNQIYPERIQAGKYIIIPKRA